MATFVMLTRLGPVERELRRSRALRLSGRVRSARRDSRGESRAMIVRFLGHAQTETWSALTWERYKELISE
jgi:hypothetical protein